MRKAFATAIIALQDDSNLFFLTGDLGFRALEDVRQTLGQRFINAGVSEQNMVGVAAGLAREGMTVFAYSIAPFCYARPYEQIRNDVCFGRLPVCLVGNGGGFAYGYMGPTHHAIEDCAAMLALGVRVLVPAFDEDVSVMTRMINSPTYLRLGLDGRPADTAIPPYAPWRKVLAGSRGALLALGPLAGIAWQALLSLEEGNRPAVWAVTELPLSEIPTAILDAINEGGPLYVLEEHVEAGGLGMQVSHALLQHGVAPRKYIHRFVPGHVTERFGSQLYHRRECGIDAQGILSMAIEPGSE
jgi:transketolase